MKRKKRWGRDQDQPGTEMLILTCISCPDSDGFRIKDNNLKIKKPVCAFYPKFILLQRFPLIPSDCPRLWNELEENNGFVPWIDYRPGKGLEKVELWEALSIEAKEVIKIVLGLPSEVLSASGWFIRKTIKMGIENAWDKSKVKKNSSNVYNELNRYVKNF